MRVIISTIGASLFFRAGRPEDEVVERLLAALDAHTDQEACSQSVQNKPGP